jgi:hypothetical protein
MIYEFPQQVPQQIIVNTVAPADIETEYRRGDFLTALYVTGIAAVVLWPGANAQLQNSMGVLVRGGGVATTEKATVAVASNAATSLPSTPSTPGTKFEPRAQDSEVGKKAIALMKSRGYHIDSAFNIIYARNALCNQPNKWCDYRLIVDGSGKVLYQAIGTSKPGNTYYRNPPNSGGVFQIDAGQHVNAWVIGTHVGLSGKNPHEALVQNRAVSGTRSYSPERTNLVSVRGMFGINIHSGYGTEEVNASSAGCLTTKTMTEHQRFMELVRQSSKPEFTVTVLDF